MDMVVHHGRIVPFKQLKTKPFPARQGLQWRHLWLLTFVWRRGVCWTPAVACPSLVLRAFEARNGPLDHFAPTDRFSLIPSRRDVGLVVLGVAFR
ncbi:MAG: hypothetical protein ABI450_08220, partial [Rhizomicrobium sp.]